MLTVRSEIGPYRGLTELVVEALKEAGGALLATPSARKSETAGVASNSPPDMPLISDRPKFIAQVTEPPVFVS
jgi:hypothetical protein